MGCGSSSAQTVTERHNIITENVTVPCRNIGSMPNKTLEAQDNLTRAKDESPDKTNQNGNISTSRDLSDSSIDEKIPKLDRINVEKPAGKRKPVPKPVAFDVEFEAPPLSDKNIQSVPKRKPPRRLKALKNAPRLTEEELHKKLAAADEKRNMALEGKRSKKEKEKQELVRTKNQNKSQEKAKRMEERLRSGLEKREKAMAERVEKQKKRRDHEKVVREKAQHRKVAAPAGSGSEHEIETYHDSGEEHHWGDAHAKPVQDTNENVQVVSKAPEPAPSTKEPNPMEDDFYGT